MIMMNDVDSQVVNEHHCKNPTCGYTWTSRKKGFVPKECPSCKSRKWRGAEPTAVPAPVEPISNPPEVIRVVKDTGALLTAAMQQNDDDEDGAPSEFIPDKYRINEE